MKNLAFCEECRNDVEYIVTEKLMTGKIKGTEYLYKGKEARCVKCNNEVYIPEIIDSNLEALYKEYRKQNGIVSLEVIREIPKKYNIGKRPLSLLLGWGEQTFTRYFDGDLPTKQYSEVLTKINENPLYYAKILEANKSNLKSHNSYEKSRKAVDLLLSGTSDKSSKIDVAINYLLWKCEDITPLALQKSLYYIQGFYFAFYNSFLFKEDCEAWIHGPVYRDIYFRYRDYRFDAITEKAEFDTSALSTSEIAVFDAVANNLCCYSGKTLERFTHSEIPWIDARGNLPISEPSDKIIAKMSIGNYFTAIKDKYNMMTPSDISAYSLDMFRNV